MHVRYYTALLAQTQINDMVTHLFIHKTSSLQQQGNNGTRGFIRDPLGQYNYTAIFI